MVKNYTKIWLLRRNVKVNGIEMTKSTQQYKQMEPGMII